MIVRRYFALAMIFLLAVLPIAGARLQAQAIGADSRDIMTTSFEQLSVSGPITVVIRTGVAPSIVAHGDRDNLDRLLVRKTGESLRLSMRRTRTDIDPSRKSANRLRIELSTWQLNRLDLNGPADVSADQLTAQAVELTIGGPGRLAIDRLAADVLAVNMLGNGSLAIAAGDADDARVELNGAPSVDAEAFETQRLNLSLIGPASVRMKVRDAAQISSSGAGFVEILGHPKCDYQGSGTSEIICGAY